MRLEINQQTIADPVTAKQIAETIRDLPKRDESIIVLWKNDEEMLQAGGTLADGFQLNYQNTRSKQDLHSTNRALKTQTVIRTMTDFANGNRAWRSAVGWNTPQVPSYAKWFDIPPGLAAFVIFTPITLFFLWKASQSGEPGTMPFADAAPRALIGIGMIAAYTQYVQVFFQHIRPRLKLAAQRAFGVAIREETASSDWLGNSTSDQWEVVGSVAIGKRLLVYATDAALLVAGLVGPVAVIGVPAFLIADVLVH